MARRCSTICLPIGKDDYLRLIDTPTAFRRWIDQAFRDWPELFPTTFGQGYTLKDRRSSKRLGIRIRRIQCNATKDAFSVRPSFAFPYMTGLTDEIATLRATVEVLADTVRRHDQQLRQLKPPKK